MSLNKYKMKTLADKHAEQVEVKKKVKKKKKVEKKEVKKEIKKKK